MKKNNQTLNSKEYPNTLKGTRGHEIINKVLKKNKTDYGWCACCGKGIESIERLCSECLEFIGEALAEKDKEIGKYQGARDMLNERIKKLEKALALAKKGRNYKTNYWELFYPDGTSSIMNYNPIKEIEEECKKNNLGEEILINVKEDRLEINKIINNCLPIIKRNKSFTQDCADAILLYFIEKLDRDNLKHKEVKK